LAEVKLANCEQRSEHAAYGLDTAIRSAQIFPRRISWLAYNGKSNAESIDQNPTFCAEYCRYHCSAINHCLSWRLSLYNAMHSCLQLWIHHLV